MILTFFTKKNKFATSAKNWLHHKYQHVRLLKVPKQAWSVLSVQTAKIFEKKYFLKKNEKKKKNFDLVLLKNLFFLFFYFSQDDS